MGLACLFKKWASGLWCNGIDPHWTVLLHGASVFFSWFVEDLCCLGGTRDTAHFKSVNGAAVHFCSQSNLVILPSSRWWRFAGEHGLGYLMAFMGRGGGKEKLFIDGEISFQYSCMLLKPTERNNNQLKQCLMKIDHSKTRLSDNLGLSSIMVRQSNLDLHNKQEI